jgi:hypothetical protein
MPRYLVERTFPHGLDVRVTDEGAQVVRCWMSRTSGDACLVEEFPKVRLELAV